VGVDEFDSRPETRQIASTGLEVPFMTEGKEKVHIQVYWKANPDMGVDVWRKATESHPGAGVWHYPAQNKRELDELLEDLNNWYEVVGEVWD